MSLSDAWNESKRILNVFTVDILETRMPYRRLWQEACARIRKRWTDRVSRSASSPGWSSWATNPLTSLSDDVAAVQRVLARQDGPALLVGHSYGGAVITESGNADNVAGLAYVAAFVPDAGESVSTKSTVSDLRRVKPGAVDESFLYLKLRAATEPASVSISGSPMPSGLPPLSAGELSAVGAWIAAGAPATGPVAAPDGDTSSGNYVARMLCQRRASTASALTGEKPKLVAPEPTKGIQFRMPPSAVPAGGEYEGCFATYT